ncbi:MAG: DNA-3-methyladenine glycosylase [Verrucomicrobia bacterium]|nr:DNA-3-methyladenine glycosylase [Verrucomicrobiota bacterium]MCG2678985.1 DNA-3-methyladenine glycosylase [Kiritimatiellia bacterium]MBU4248337.1 DNA-3-methyladenine glycosylase [Verrucomicrobiota bacterium]MBU4289722.1 DNA-3-methyladenine glycosylase [Verrucomicrobiota bacterium]MBU4428564.1 DNA-3-methyladenine glycosylase [Verrucomicrobiota bacterium]
MALKLTASFFLQADVVKIGRELLGKMLFTHIGRGPVCGGIIVETEAYGGARDRASHAYGNRRTRRTEVMFHGGGVAYVYLCYGIHSLFNIITNKEGIPDAVLIRAIQPVHGIEVMLKRRRKVRRDCSLGAGPGALSQALGIGLKHNGISVSGDVIWLEQGIRIRPSQIASGPRIGVQYAGADAQRPWRFWIRGSEWISRPIKAKPCMAVH